MVIERVLALGGNIHRELGDHAAARGAYRQAAAVADAPQAVEAARACAALSSFELGELYEAQRTFRSLVPRPGEEVSDWLREPREAFGRAMADADLSADDILCALDETASDRTLGICPSVDLRIEFDYDSAAGRVEDARSFRLVGHSDPCGDAEYNQDLSERKAQSAERARCCAGPAGHCGEPGRRHWQGRARTVDHRAQRSRPPRQPPRGNSCDLRRECVGRPMARRGSWEDDTVLNTTVVSPAPKVRGRLCRLPAACLACLAASAAVAEPRVALVVGNNAYQEAPLDNPLNDARLIAGTLRELGFEVSTGRNADEDAMEEAIVLGERLQARGAEAVVLFYYAGHGVQSTAGRNYPIPVGAAIRGESRLAAKAVSADGVLPTMRNSGNAVNVLNLDACRNNPYVARRGARGLAAMVPGSDSLIAFSAAAGQTAEDGDGNNSAPAALAAAMRRPGLTFAQVFQNVRKRVPERQRHRPAGERQTPTEVSQLTRDHIFVPSSGVPVRISHTPQPVDWAREEWGQIKGTSRAEALEGYIGPTVIAGTPTWRSCGWARYAARLWVTGSSSATS